MLFQWDQLVLLGHYSCVPSDTVYKSLPGKFQNSNKLPVLIIIIKTVLDWGVVPGNFDVSKLLICKHLENLYLIYYYAPLAGSSGALTMISLRPSNVLLDY